MEKLVQEAAGFLQQGASPEQVVQAIVEQGGGQISEEEAIQIVQAAMQAMQGGGQGGQPQEGGEGGSVLEAALQEDPELVYAIIMEFSQLAPEQQEALMQEIEGMLQGGQGQEQAPQQPQGSGMFQ